LRRFAFRRGCPAGVALLQNARRPARVALGLDPWGVKLIISIPDRRGVEDGSFVYFGYCV